MKKEENQKASLIKDNKNSHDSRSRSYSPKPYIGCDTCKQKNSEPKKVKSIGKFSDDVYNVDGNKLNRLKKTFQGKEREEMRKTKIKLTDLCDEDKKRIVELIEELSKFAEKNKKLKDTLDNMQKIRAEQQDYIMKQATLHLEEKNCYINEINVYKCKLESFETDMKNKISKWESQEKLMDNEIAYFAKALEDSLKEKNELNEQIIHLKNCLRQSLESFQQLREEVNTLQSQENAAKRLKSISCQTRIRNLNFKERNKPSRDSTKEESFAVSNQNDMDAKSSLDIIYDKLEHVYQLLKRKSENFGKHDSQKFDIDLSILLKNKTLNGKESQIFNAFEDENLKEIKDQDFPGIKYKFLKPFDQCSKTSVQAERILKKIEKPLNLPLVEFDKKKLDNELRDFEMKKYIGDVEMLANNTVKKKIVQKNNLFRTSGSQQCNEDRLLEELFYSDRNINLGLESVLEEKNEESESY